MSDNHPRISAAPRTTCLWCGCPLNTSEPAPTCDRCDEWDRRRFMNPARLSIDELYELEAYSRIIYTRPRTPQELELEQTARKAAAYRRMIHAH